ncbi:MAG: hypothetical protein V3U54_13240 [Thermodesulfobacteriota bacterium]
MKYCESCFAVGLDDDLFCPNCGQEYSSVHHVPSKGVRAVDSRDVSRIVNMKAIPMNEVSWEVPFRTVDRKDVKIKREIIRGDGSNIDDFLKPSYPGLYESTFSDIADAYTNITPSVTPKGILKFSNIPPEQVKMAMDEWQEKLKQDPDYIPVFALPEDANVEFVQFDKPRGKPSNAPNLTSDRRIGEGSVNKKKKTIRQRLRTRVAWGLLFVIALLVVSLLNIQLTGTI